MKITKFLTILFLIVIFIIAGYSFVKWKEHEKTVDEVDNFLESQNYTVDIKSKKAKYNFKTGDTYVIVFYKDLPSIRYEYYYNSHHKEVRGYAVSNENNVEVTTDKYLP
ncbi:MULTISPECIES: DUF3139 domain-containing protein [Lysinibacillus]|uniref:DUF3139 domain-containing protein n=1 Tax=Lysinibacillus fusiformis TaxID=28031 RepID=A0A1E4RA77_9BACI|nr:MULTISPECIES: DUF3139 domain-containing protein [Lysinibacillus]ODV57363.1 hypothetical protein BG258_16305 [Lysinibacillus fusiformis]